MSHSLEVAGNGYLNIRLDRGAYGYGVIQGRDESSNDRAGEKIIVEHTNINPNKAAHIGHLRNAILGDTFVRMLRAAGNTVEVQNYIDNTGVQVADVVVGFHYLENKTPAEVAGADRRAGVRFDYYCWDLYARTSQLLQGQSRSAEVARRNAARDRGGRRRQSPNSATWWPTPSCRRIWRPCCASASSTMCCRARARSSICSSGRPRSSC